MHFRHLSVADGLSQNAVFALHQDSDGYLWIGTEQGLNRYDGYNIQQFHRGDISGQGLPDSFVYDLTEDSNGDIWIATARGGLARWSQADEQIQMVPLGAQNDTLPLRALEMLPNGELWIGTLGKGILVYQTLTGTVRQYRHDSTSATSLADDSIYDFEPGQNGDLWIATDNGLSRFDPITELFSNFRSSDEPPHRLSHDRIRTLTTDHRQQLWIGTFGGGVSVLDPLSDTFRHYRHEEQSPRSLSHDHVRTIFVDDDQRVWVGTEAGLNLFDETLGEFSQYRGGRATNELSDSDILTIAQDDSGQMWIGTRNAGVNIWNPRGWLMGHRLPEWAKTVNVTSFADDVGSYWVGTFGNGLGRVHSQSGESRQYTTQQGLPDDRVMSLARDAFGQLWIGSMHGGLSRLDLKTETVTRWRPKKELAFDTTALSEGGIMSLLTTRAGSIWIGTFGRGLWHLDARTGRVLDIGAGTYSVLAGRQIMALQEDPSGMLWVGTDEGLHLLNPHRGIVSSYLHDRADPHSLSADAVYSLHIDRNGRLWIGTSDGGISWWEGKTSAPEDGRFGRLAAERLQVNTVYGIRSDRLGRLWISGNTGLVKYDPGPKAIIHYGPAHGLQGADFNFGAHHSDDNGYLYFGGANGYNRFRADNLVVQQRTPSLVLTEYAKQNRAVVEEAPFSRLQSTSAGYDDSVLSFEFAMLDFIDPGSNRYSYLLAGFDEQWSPFTTQRRATYTNLDSGNYQLRVRARDASGASVAKELTIALSVAPPPWALPWAYAAYGLLVLVGLGLLYRNHIARLARAAHIEQLAFYDTLTGLPNRHLFLTQTERRMAPPNQVSLVLLGLDRFKRINDTLGHELGDQVLTVVAQRLQRSLAVEGLSKAVPDLSLSRLGSDEFVVTVVNRKGLSNNAFNVVSFAQRLAQQLSLPITDHGLDLVMTASIGISSYPDDAEDLVTLLKHADSAMSHAKASDRNSCRVYASVMDERAAERLALEADIRRALEADEFQLYYQPKFSADTTEINGAEVLLRWQRDDGTWISPFEILSIAQELGFSGDIDRWVLKQACQQQQRWRGTRAALQPLAVNLSTASLCRVGFAEWLCELVDDYHLAPSMLELEITESALMEDRLLAQSTLQTLKHRGFNLAIDDFGTGYSSLAYLKQFNVDVLKIDRSFVMDLEADANNLALCRAMIAMAHSLGLKVVAEGVETERQRELLAAQHVDYLQGYLLAKPMPTPEFEALLLAPGRASSAG